MDKVKVNNEEVLKDRLVAINRVTTVSYTHLVSLPRIRDFKGIESKFDGCGNYTLGITEQIIFRSEEHTSELQSRDSISYAVFCLPIIASK